jgi:hypothetical protein
VANQGAAPPRVVDNGPQFSDDDDEFRQHSGKGTSQQAEDNLLPNVGILQSNSPAADKRNPAYIEGAEPGAFVMKSGPQVIVSGEEGIYFQSCFFTKKWAEWVPREKGGGYVARHDDLPPEATRVETEGRREKYVLPNGNELVETRYHVGFLLHGAKEQMVNSGGLQVPALVGGVAVPYSIPFSSTGHTVSKDWMFKMNNIRFGDGSVQPSFTRAYKLTTRQRTNKAGTWFVISVGQPLLVAKDQARMGLALSTALEAGEKDIGEEVEQEASQGSSGSHHDPDGAM